MTSSQVPTQPQRSNDTPTMRMQPVVEPAWPTSEPRTATDLTPAAAVTTKLEPVVVPPAGRGMAGVLPAVPEQSAPRSPGAPAGFGVPAPGAAPTIAVPTIAAPPAVTATPAPGVPVPGAPLNGTPMPGTPLNGTPLNGTPTPGSPLNGTPVNGTPAPGQAAAPSAPAAPTAPAAKPAAPYTPRSRWRRIARKIVGPTLLTKRG